MAATACTERLLRPDCSPGERSPPGPLWRVAFGVSLLLHGALLWLPVSGQGDRGASSAPLPALTLTLKPPAMHATVPVATPSSAVPTLSRRGDPPRARSLPRAAPAASVAPLAPVTTQAATPPRLDLDELRAQARDLARAPAELRVRGGDRPDQQVPATDPLDAPRLEALARRIGKPLRVASEQRLADGSRRIRFVGNVCLHIPQHLPPGFENSFGPTVLLPTNCPN